MNNFKFNMIKSETENSEVQCTLYVGLLPFDQCRIHVIVTLYMCLL